MRNDHALAPAAAALGVAVLSGMDAAIKIVVSSYPITEVVGLRYAIGAMFAVVAFVAEGETWPRRDTLGRNFIRAIVIVLTSVCFFTALSRLPLAESIALTFVMPLCLVLLGWLILKESITPRALLGIVLGLIGVMVIAHGQKVDAHRAFDLIGIMAALGCAFLYALSNVLTRRQSGRDSIMVQVLLGNVFAMLLSAPLMIADWRGPTVWHFGAFVVAGLLGTCGQYCIAWAYARAPVGRLGVYEYTALLWAAILGFLIFSEIPSPWTITGAVLIFIACLASTSRPQRRSHSPNNTVSVPAPHACDSQNID